MFSFSFLLDRCRENVTFSDFCKGTNIEETAGCNGSKYKHLFSSSRQLSLLREDVKCCATVLQGVTHCSTHKNQQIGSISLAEWT